MNKFKRKPVPFSSVALGRRMAADAQRERVKAAKRKSITFFATLLSDDVLDWDSATATASTAENDGWTGPGYWATANDLPGIDNDTYTQRTSVFNWSQKPAASSGEPTKIKTVYYSTDATVA